MRPTQRIILCLLAATFAAPRLAAQTDTLSSAREALKAKDYANAIKLYQQYLQENPDAPDAPKTAMLVGYITDAAKATSLDVRAAFQAVRDKYPNSDEAKEALFRIGMLKIREKDHEVAKAIFQSVLTEDPKSAAASRARFPLANYQIKDARLDDAIDLFAQVAADPRVEPAMRDEALLQTGFLLIQEYFAPKLILRDGTPAPPQTEASRLALVQAARTRLEQVAGELGQLTDNPKVHQTATAYAECGVAEAYLLEGMPGGAEMWYRRAIARDPSLVQAPVIAMAFQGLGVAFYRQGRLVEAAQALDAAIKHAASGTVLYGLSVPDFLTAQAQTWRARVAVRLGRRDQAISLTKASLEYFQGKEPTDPDAHQVWLVSTRYIEETERQDKIRAMRTAKALEPNLRIASSAVSTMASPETKAASSYAALFGTGFGIEEGGSR